jgi:hypothetical protein
VSAGQASSAAVGSVRDPVRASQRTLHRSAKADPGRRFHALRDTVYRRDVLWRAWVMVAAGSLFTSIIDNGEAIHAREAPRPESMPCG